PTVPAAGVMPTSPAIAPEAAPSAEGRPLVTASTTLHATTPAAVATIVLIIASDAISSAATAEPALKPNQPTHSSEAPMKVNGTLCGFSASLPKPRRLPRKYAPT